MSDSSALLNFYIPAITLGFAAASQPGPLSIYLISRTLQTGWRKTFPAVFTPMITDGPVAVLCLAIVGALPKSFLVYLQIIGALFITYLAFKTYLAWKTGSAGDDKAGGSKGKTLKDAIIINIFNPNAYIAWSLVIGPLFMRGWNENHFTGIFLLIFFYTTMTLMTILIIYLFDKARARGGQIRQILLGVSALLLAFFGIYQLLRGIMGLF